MASKQVAGKRRGGEVYEKSLEMRHFRVFPYPEAGELAHNRQDKPLAPQHIGDGVRGIHNL